MPFPVDRSQHLLERVLDRELARLQKRKRLLPALKPLPVSVPAPTLRRVAVVAADAGNLELRLHPLRIGLIQVATSESPLAFGATFLSLNAPIAELVSSAFAERSLLPLASTARACGLDPEQPQRWLPSDSSVPRPLDFLRELLEWLLVVHVARTVEADTLLLRDGLLRTIVLPRGIFDSLITGLREATAARRVLLCALAKRIPGGDEFVSYIDLAVSAELRDGRGPAAFEIPDAVEADFSPAGFASTKGRRAGVLALLALTPRQRHRPLAVEIPHWQRERAADILGALAGAARGGYPEPGHPPELLQAHLAARISPLQREYLAREFLTRILRVRPELRDRLLASHLLGEAVVVEPEPGAEGG